jgi:hypothetical protein
LLARFSDDDKPLHKAPKIMPLRTFEAE